MLSLITLTRRRRLHAADSTHTHEESGGWGEVGGVRTAVLSLTARQAV